MVIDTVKDMPPEIVFENSEFIVGIELKNRGAYDVSNGVVALARLANTTNPNKLYKTIG